MKIIAVLPTYNESENIRPLIKSLLKVSRFLEVVVVDDNSPDGTWRLVEGMVKENPRVHLVHRTTEKGRGSAGVAGFRRALELGADLVVEMDADWSHHPRFLRGMIRATGNADLVIGSRLVAGGGETGRSRLRTLITLLANAYIRLCHGLKVRDCTSGYRVYRRWLLERIDWDRVRSNGPAIVQEQLIAAIALEARVREVPILFEERRAGQSTFTTQILIAGLLAQLRLRLQPAPVRTL
jgi:dolichol-phosphate mannosyltransferase